MLTRKLPYGEGNQAIPQARGILRVCVSLAAEEGVLHAIKRDVYAVQLALGVLSQYVLAGQVTLEMVDRWLGEAIANEAAKLDEKEQGQG